MLAKCHRFVSFRAVVSQVLPSAEVTVGLAFDLELFSFYNELVTGYFSKCTLKYLSCF